MNKMLFNYYFKVKIIELWHNISLIETVQDRIAYILFIYRLEAKSKAVKKSS